MLSSNSNSLYSPTSRTSPFNYKSTSVSQSPTAVITNLSSSSNLLGNGHSQTVPHHKMNGNIVTNSSPVQNGNTFRFVSNNSSSLLIPSNYNGPNSSLSAKQPLLDVSKTGIQNSQLNSSRKSMTLTKLTSPNETGQVQPNGLDLILDPYGVHEMLASLALMCLLSLLMAFLALFFLQRTGPILTLPEVNRSAENGLKEKTWSVISHSKIMVNAKEYIRVFQVSVSLSTLTISLNLCCLFVCCIQFLSAVKLLKTSQGRKRTHDFLKKTSHVRVTAIGAFLISIPIFFTGVILFTFINFDEVPALATSVVIGIGIVFCGLASVQNVYLWQSEKTKASQELSESRLSQLRESGLLPSIELSTLV